MGQDVLGVQHMNCMISIMLTLLNIFLISVSFKLICYSLRTTIVDENPCYVLCVLEVLSNFHSKHTI